MMIFSSSFIGASDLPVFGRTVLYLMRMRKEIRKESLICFSSPGIETGLRNGITGRVRDGIRITGWNRDVIRITGWDRDGIRKPGRDLDGIRITGWDGIAGSGAREAFPRPGSGSRNGHSFSRFPTLLCHPQNDGWICKFSSRCGQTEEFSRSKTQPPRAVF